MTYRFKGVGIDDRVVGVVRLADHRRAPDVVEAVYRLTHAWVEHLVRKRTFFGRL